MDENTASDVIKNNTANKKSKYGMYVPEKFDKTVYVSRELLSRLLKIHRI